MTLVSEAIGLAAVLMGGLGVKPLLKCLRAQFRIPKISDDEKVQGMWKDLYRHPDPSGQWIGNCERVFLYFALIHAPWEAIGAWLLFKLGSKWEAWNQMGYVPDDPNRRDKDGNIIGEEIHLLKWAYARRIWAAQGYGTFVVGTAANLFLAAIGVFVATRGAEILDCLGTLQVR
jgi:hypothetical protein